MGKIIVIMGKSATGKDTIYKRLIQELGLSSIVSYTTRPIRSGEISGVEYHFVTVTRLEELRREGKVIEERTYHTVCGDWHYFTVNDGQFDEEEKNYAIVGTLEQYAKIREFFGVERVLPVYIEVDGADRLTRSVLREKVQKQPQYTEICRRFIADEEDFSEENLKLQKILKRYQNNDLETCIMKIEEDLRRIL